MDGCSFKRTGPCRRARRRCGYATCGWRASGNVSGGGTGSGSTGNDTSSPIPESQVTGLIADLGARPIKGPALAAGRTAIVDASGLIESATGNATDCMHVDGSSGPCGGGTPTFVDGDLPSGIVDGNNATFALTAVPAPATSLSLYRNGVLQKLSLDYTATGNSIQFVAAATPQPGDTLLASYRTADSSGAVTSTFSGYSTPQVLCSGAGATINSATLTSLGACTIPAGLLSQGDRVEIRFDYSHGGTAGGFSIETHWGGNDDCASGRGIHGNNGSGSRRRGSAGVERAIELGDMGNGSGIFGERSGGGRRLRQRADDHFSGVGGERRGYFDVEQFHRGADSVGGGRQDEDRAGAS